MSEITRKDSWKHANQALSMTDKTPTNRAGVYTAKPGETIVGAYGAVGSEPLKDLSDQLRETPTQEPMWDEKAAIDESQKLYPSQGVNDTHKATCFRWTFVDGARWQFEKDKAQLEKMASQLDLYFKANDVLLAENLKLQQENEKLKAELAKCKEQRNSYIEDACITETERSNLIAEAEQELKALRGEK